MGILKILISLVGRMATAIVLEANDLVEWVGDPTDRRTVTVLAVSVLVEIVTEMYDNVEIVSTRDSGIGVEVALGIIRTGCDG